MFLRKFFALASIISTGFTQQIPMNSPADSSLPSLADLLTLETRTSIFYDYARELKLSEIFADLGSQFTILAPVNKAVIALPRKPHQSPKNNQKMGVILTEEQYETQSTENVRRWVSAHIIPGSPLPLSDKTYPTLLEDKSVTFTPIESEKDQPEWAKVQFEDEGRIIDKREAANGVLYIIDSTVHVN